MCPMRRKIADVRAGSVAGRKHLTSKPDATTE
jgi:hypothetical protein